MHLNNLSFTTHTRHCKSETGTLQSRGLQWSGLSKCAEFVSSVTHFHIPGTDPALHFTRLTRVGWQTRSMHNAHSLSLSKTAALYSYTGVM